MSKFKEREERILEYWEKIDLPKKMAEIDFNKKPFFLLDGPPYANDRAHVGHVKTIVAKDIFVKFKKLQGYSVFHVPGFDMHGLPIEVKVEKELNIKTKKEIEEKVDEFIKKCEEFAHQNMEKWLCLYKKLGAWKGWYEPYKTSNLAYLNSAWHTIKTYFEKGLLVEGEKPIFWCPRCQTVLTGYEVTDSYKEIEDPSIIVKFPIKEKENEFLLVWTTTPWTLPANVAVAVHPDEIYVKVKVGEEVYILAEKRLEILEELELSYTILEKFKGETLADLKYTPLIQCKLQKELEEEENAHKIVLSIPLLKKKISSKILAKKEVDEKKEEVGHLVTMDVGTGLVHIAPGHGNEDFELGKHYNLPSPSPLDDECKFKEEVELWKGKFVKEADKEIIEYLKNKNLLLYAGKIRHSYPLCWRCKTPLIFRKTKQWFLKVSEIRDKIIEEAEKVNWFPSFAKIRYLNWASNLEDWALSRQRYWGITLPIWRCENCNAIEVFESKERLEERANCKIEDLHKNEVDKITFKCRLCEGLMRREPYVLDVWFDSGIAPWASLNYPFENKELFDYLFPCALVIEGQDQIRGWFNSLMVCSVALFGKAPYKNVGMTGWLLDEKGEKMSKSLGNVIWGDEAYEKLGADVLRFYYCKEVAPWEVQKFSFSEAKTIEKFLTILENLAKFYLEYCKEFSREEIDLENLSLREEDKWILSRINSLIKEYTSHLENFELHHAGKKISDFIINDLSRYYIKLVRERLEIYANEKEKQTVSTILNYIFKRILVLLSPITPFICEDLYQALFKKEESIFFESWPEEKNNLIDKDLEKEISLVFEVVSAFLARRQEKGLRLRWPIKRGIIYAYKEVLEILRKHEDIIKKLANLKELEYNDKVEFEIKPNYEKIGKKFGKDTKKIVSLLSSLNPKEIYNKDKIEIQDFSIKKEDLIFRVKGEGSSFSLGLVDLIDEETEEIKEERFIRELIRAIQTKRKELKLKVKDKIILYLSKKDWIKKWEDLLKKETNAEKILYECEKGEEIAYKELKVKFSVSKE